MVTYIIRRLLWMIVLLLVVSFLTFIIFYVLPSADPARAARRPQRRRRSCVAAIRQTLGLDKPWYVQYWKLPRRDLVFHFDFGYSYQNNVVGQGADLRPPAGDDLARRSARVVVWLLIGIPIGIISAIRRGTLARPAGDGRARWSRSPRRSTGSASSSLYLFADDIGKFPIFAGLRRVPVDGSIFTDPVAVVPVADPAVARARRRVRGDLRALPARQPASR